VSSPMNTDVAAQGTSSTTIQGLADSVQTLLGKMQGEVDATAAIWMGDAHTAFMGGTAEINAQLQKGQAAMQEVSMKVGKSGTGYGSTDGSNAASLGSTGL
jgi:WXG100 family type VII secretion target